MKIVAILHQNRRIGRSTASLRRQFGLADRAGRGLLIALNPHASPPRMSFHILAAQHSDSTTAPPPMNYGAINLPTLDPQGTARFLLQNEILPRLIRAAACVFLITHTEEHIFVPGCPFSSVSFTRSTLSQSVSSPEIYLIAARAPMSTLAPAGMICASEVFLPCLIEKEGSLIAPSTDASDIKERFAVQVELSDVLLDTTNSPRPSDQAQRVALPNERLDAFPHLTLPQCAANTRAKESCVSKDPSEEGDQPSENAMLALREVVFKRVGL